MRKTAVWDSLEMDLREKTRCAGGANNGHATTGHRGKGEKQRSNRGLCVYKPGVGFASERAPKSRTKQLAMWGFS